MEIQGTLSYGTQNTMQNRSSEAMTDEQKNKLAEIIAAYDPENLFESDRTAMMKEIQGAGITPSRELGQILNDAGFAPPEGPAPGGDTMTPPPPSAEETDFTSSELLDLLEQYKNEEISEEEFLTQLDALREQADTTTGNLVDQSA